MERFYFNKQLNQGKGAVDTIDVTASLITLFSGATINYENNQNIIGQIVQQTNAEFYKKLCKYFHASVSPPC